MHIFFLSRDSFKFYLRQPEYSKNHQFCNKVREYRLYIIKNPYQQLVMLQDFNTKRKLQAYII